MAYQCPEPNCEATEYITGCTPEGSELGVIVDRDGNATNRWEDGVVGVPEDVVSWIQADDCAPYCPLHDQETEWNE